MLKSIKKFFKWIADHTGISWVLGKLGWQSTGKKQEEDFVFLGESQSKAPAEGKNVSLKVVDGKIKLIASAENYEVLEKHLKNKKGDGTVIDGEFRLNIKDELYITGRYDSKTITEDDNISLSINSVGTLDGEKIYGNDKPEEMKKLLDLSDSEMSISISLNVPEVIASGDDVPNSETTSPEAKQHIGANDQSVSV